jgi:hypothetical protein
VPRGNSSFLCFTLRATGGRGPVPWESQSKGGVWLSKREVQGSQSRKLAIRCAAVEAKDSSSGTKEEENLNSRASARTKTLFESLCSLHSYFRPHSYEPTVAHSGNGLP